MKYLLILLIAFTSCVSLKPARDIDKAENKIKKYNKGITNQLERYPSLIDEAFTATKTDSILIPGDSIVVDKIIQDTSKLSELAAKYKDTSFELYEAGVELDYIEALNENEQRKLQSIRNVLSKNQAKLDSIFDQYKRTSALLNQVGIIEKDAFNLKYVISNGKISIKAELKDSYKIINTSTTTNEITIKDKFYQDPKFWIYLIIALTLLYFVGDKIVMLWKSFIDNIISFIKRLLFKL